NSQSLLIMELFSGSSTLDDVVSKKILGFLQFFNEIDLNKDIAKRAGELFRDVNKGLGVADYIIAASALVTGYIVITLNKKHFEQIPHIVIYPL
ncbi:PIN domain-containing protein, partial [Patescibacteria group bacterium]|nr:PIN domain-containing protein [Patescibacteria group bacterium]